MARLGTRGWRALRRNAIALTLAAAGVALGATAAYAASSGFNIPDGATTVGSYDSHDHGGRIDITYSQNVHTSQIRPVVCMPETHVPISGYKTVAANDHSHQVLASNVITHTCSHLQIADLPGHNERYMGTVEF